MNDKTKQLFMVAAVAGLMSTGAVYAKDKAAKKAAKAEPTGKCTQSNECGGHGACKGSANGSAHECGGKNACKSNVIEGITEKDCHAKDAKATWTK